MQVYISSMFVCLSALDLSNGGTYEYQIWTADSCDDTDEDEVLIFYVYWLFLEKTPIYQISKFPLYL